MGEMIGTIKMMMRIMSRLDVNKADVSEVWALKVQVGARGTRI